MEYKVYYDFYYECLKIMKHLGKFMTLAMNDLNEKANNIKDNTVKLSDELNLFEEKDDEYIYIMKFI